MYDEDAPMNAAGEEPPADRQMAEALRRQLRDAEKAGEYHRSKVDEHQMRADEAARCAKAATRALDVLEPSEKAMDVQKVERRLSEFEEGRSF